MGFAIANLGRVPESIIQIDSNWYVEIEISHNMEQGLLLEDGAKINLDMKNWISFGLCGIQIDMPC